MMKHTNQHIQQLWIRLSATLALAALLVLSLLFLPLAGSATPDNSHPLPVGVQWVQAQSGLTITKVANTNAITPGGTIIFTLTFTNNTVVSLGPGSVAIQETAPANTSLDCSSANQPSKWTTPICTSDEVVWGVDFSSTIDPGEIAIFKISAVVDNPLSGVSEVVNDDYFVAQNTPPYDREYGPTVIVPVIAPGWEITKTVPSPTVEPGGRITYTITLTNNGTAATSGVYTITETLPDHTHYVTNSAPPGAIFDTNGDILTWTLYAPVAAGNATAVSFVVTTTEVLTDNTPIVNDTYSIGGGNVYTATTPGDPVTVLVDSDVVLAISKIASSDVITVGEVLTYTLIVTNTSDNGPALNVRITDTLPAAVSYQSAGFVGGVPGSVITNGGNPIVWVLDNPLQPKATVKMTVAVKVSDTLPNPPVLTNQYRVSADNAATVSKSLDTDVTPSTPTTLTVTTGSASLQICETTVVTTLLTDEAENPIVGEQVNLNVIGSGGGTVTPNSGTTNQNGIFVSTFLATASGTPRILGEWAEDIFVNNNPGLEITVGSTAVPTDLTLTAAPSPLAAGGADALVTATLQYCSATPPVDPSGKTINFSVSDITLATLDTASELTDGNGDATAMLTSGTLSGTLTITATGEGLVDTFELPIHTPVLTITKSAIPTNQVKPGETITYTVRVDNIGDVPAAGVRLTDTLPELLVSYVGMISSTNSAPGDISGPSFSGSNNRDVTISTSNLNPNTSLTATIYVTVTATTSGTVLSNQASAGSSASTVETSNIVDITVVTATTTVNGNVYLPIIMKVVTP